MTASRVLGDTEDVWTAVFKTLGGTYQPPTLVLFPGRVRSACGIASEAAGPFYCPGDQKLYLDTTFFDELAQRFRAPGDFAQAYVIAHEVGHHVQNLTGTMRQVDAQRQRLGERGNNALSVRLELQADCYAGVWGFFAQKRNKLDPGDIEEGLAAAAAVGDDRIQRADAGLRRSRLVHARLRRPAPVLVQGRPRERRRAQVRHVRSARALTAFDVHVQDKPTRCPGCAATMQPLRLTRKLEGELTVDLCADCQALWFDAFESGQLTPGATLELFAAIRKARPAARRALPARLPCPRCTLPLSLTHDLQHTTRFLYYRCESGHGRFTPFVQFLREKDFIRPLTPAERTRLLASIRKVSCSSCGAPVDLEKESACPVLPGPDLDPRS